MPPRSALSSLPIRLRTQGRIKLRSGRSPCAYWVNRCSYCAGPPYGVCLILSGTDRLGHCAMGYNARSDEIRDNITRMRREWEAQRGSLATVRRFNATLSAKGYVWFWPKIAAALTSKYHWLVIACDSCDTVVDLDLRVKPRDPEA